jgi:hypothetical protein
METANLIRGIVAQKVVEELQAVLFYDTLKKVRFVVLMTNTKLSGTE